VTPDDADHAVRVLIVEDDARVRTALRSFLSASEGFEVVGDAADAATALRMAREWAPAVAVVDVLLPDASDGLALLRILTADLSIPAIAISIDDQFSGDALAAGAHRFLDKDSAPEQLLGALRAAAGRPAHGGR
jgi:DNA-binding NarL/FixJ family response regulator